MKGLRVFVDLYYIIYCYISFDKHCLRNFCITKKISGKRNIVFVGLQRKNNKLNTPNPQESYCGITLHHQTVNPPKPLLFFSGCIGCGVVQCDYQSGMNQNSVGALK